MGGGFLKFDTQLRGSVGLDSHLGGGTTPLRLTVEPYSRCQALQGTEAIFDMEQEAAIQKQYPNTQYESNHLSDRNTCLKRSYDPCVHGFCQ